MSRWDFEQLTQTAVAEFEQAKDAQTLEDLRVKYLGRKGLLAEIYASFPTLSAEEKPVVGKEANVLKTRVTGLVAVKKEQIAQQEQAQAAAAGAVDVTLPGVAAPMGHAHILTQILEEICGIFEGLGFVVYEGPEIETEFNNFTALNIPADHPSRDAFDTFYLDAKDPQNKDRHLLLRSHTSPAQNRVMRAYPPPLAVIVPGKVYRPDAVDASHSFMFHQVEGLLIDEDIKFSDLKGLLSVFCQRFFGEKVRMRFRPHFFPFTEPSAEVDISCDLFKGKSGSRNKEWLEIMGCGMVHPQVFAAAGYPKGKYTGLAFGMGVERMAMLRYGITDIRAFYENDVRFLKQF